MSTQCTRKTYLTSGNSFPTLKDMIGNMGFVAPDFKNKTSYAPYVSPGSPISHIATNKGNINRQCLIYNILSIKDITLDSKQRKDNSDLRVKTPILQGQLTG